MDTIAPQNPSADADRLDGFVHKFVKNAWYVCAQVGAAFMKFVRGVQGQPGLAVKIQPFLRKVAAKGRG